jgi:hypothetical protein
MIQPILFYYVLIVLYHILGMYELMWADALNHQQRNQLAKHGIFDSTSRASQLSWMCNVYVS